MSKIVDKTGQPIEEKQKIAFICAANSAYMKYAIPFWKSMTKFHSPEDIDMIFYTDEKDRNILAKLPKGIKVEPLEPFLKDPLFWYRQKPVMMEPLLDQYDLVVGFDADQLILGSLDYIIQTRDYDVGTVINWNRTDPQVYGAVEMLRIGIAPVEYFNCGLVALRSKKFAHHWKMLCYSPQFDRVQYKEQDILNVLCYYGNYNVRCFDHGDGIKNYQAWHGLIAKGETVRAIVTDGEIVIPQGLGDQPFPPKDMKLKAITLGGGHGAIKDNWDAYFPPEVMERINELVK